jgi:hypothetical protein
MPKLTPAKSEQLATIKQLEEELNKIIPQLQPDQEIEWDTVGYQTGEQGNIVGLGLYHREVKTEHCGII